MNLRPSGTLRFCELNEIRHKSGWRCPEQCSLGEFEGIARLLLPTWDPSIDFLKLPRCPFSRKSS